MNTRYIVVLMALALIGCAASVLVCGLSLLQQAS